MDVPCSSLSHAAGSLPPLLTPMPCPSPHVCLVQISLRPTSPASWPAPPTRGLRPPPHTPSRQVARMGVWPSTFFHLVSARPPAPLPRSIRVNLRRLQNDMVMQFGLLGLHFIELVRCTQNTEALEFV
uniref:Uncharacterized protein n=1 Tax=Zea mays TaxID=4577 RepID=A0A804QBX9_MAIZE